MTVDSTVTPILEHHARRLLAGLSYFGDPVHSHGGWTEENEIGRLWKRLIEYLTHDDCPYPYPAISYEVHIQHHDTLTTGEYEVFVGFEVPDATGIPIDLCLKILPEATYAVFTMRGAQMRSDEPIIDNWFTAARYERSFPFGMQRYDERFLGLDRLAESELDFIIPVRPVERDERG